MKGICCTWYMARPRLIKWKMEIFDLAKYVFLLMFFDSHLRVTLMLLNIFLVQSVSKSRKAKAERVQMLYVQDRQQLANRQTSQTNNKSVACKTVALH